MTMTPYTHAEEMPPQTQTPEEAQTLCARLMEHTGDMVALLERETNMLRGGKPQEITALQARKTALSTALTRDMRTLRHDCEFIKKMFPDHIEAIKEQHILLKKSLTANQDALTAMKAVSESMLHTIAAKLGENKTGPELYGKNAGMIGKAITAPTAISFDETL